MNLCLFLLSSPEILETSIHWFICSCSVFGRIYGAAICLQFYLTFRSFNRAEGSRFLAGNVLEQMLTVLIYSLCNQDQESLSFSLLQKLEIFYVIN